MPAVSLESPNVANYRIGKGKVSFKKEGEGDFRDVGNVVSFEFTPSIEKLEHFSSREGVKTKDRTVVLSKSGSLNLQMEEWSAANLAMILLGDVETDSDGNDSIEIFSQNAISGELKFESTNEVGPKWDIHLLKVDFIPGSAINPISDEWGVLEVTGDVAAVDGSFGRAVLTANEAGADESL